MKDATKAVIGGRNPAAHSGTVNQPVYHASTIVFPTVAELRASNQIRPGDGLSYGVHGTPATFAFEEAVALLEGGYRTRLCNSGLQACSGPLLAFAGAGDHVLVPDNVYGPVRTFADGLAKRMGIETSYYDPAIGGAIRDLIRPNTKIVWTEAPGSWTFEMQDIPAIAEEAHRAGATVIMDNTWASPLYFKPFEHGVDVSIQAATKYIGGHSDFVMGTVTATEAAYPAIQQVWRELGLCGAPDDVFLAARGLRTIDVRLERHWKNGLEIGHWLKARPEVAEVIHPAMEHDPGYALWSRDFLGAASLFAFTLQEQYSTDACLSAFLDQSEHFAMGYSWGGFESLLIPVDPKSRRSATPWPKPDRPQGQTLRIHVGLEAPSDLIDDLTEGFKRMVAAA
ncbi:MAG: cystathionine beta-lyase [Pseudomonadota bacterium]